MLCHCHGKQINKCSFCFQTKYCPIIFFAILHYHLLPLCKYIHNSLLSWHWCAILATYLRNNTLNVHHCVTQNDAQLPFSFQTFYQQQQLGGNIWTKIEQLHKIGRVCSIFTYSFTFVFEVGHLRGKAKQYFFVLQKHLQHLLCWLCYIGSYTKGLFQERVSKNQENNI